ncbi:MAG: hypothetical protein NZ750_04225 [Anaerolineae bacterium]|nr:hypothetical protein [Anaerolineae bacterium]MDW8171528.1 hypothetical protein [Anaerolineae bacterium]
MHFDPQKLIRAQALVAVLAIGGIGAFLLIYALLDSVQPLMRLLLALCLPPLLIAAVLIGYLLFVRRLAN